MSSPSQDEPALICPLRSKRIRHGMGVTGLAYRIGGDRLLTMLAIRLSGRFW